MKKYKENASFTKKSTAERIVYIVVFVLFFLYAASLLYPFLWGLLSSLKGVDEYLDSPFSRPSGWLFSNYASAFEMLRYQRRICFPHRAQSRRYRFHQRRKAQNEGLQHDRTQQLSGLARRQLYYGGKAGRRLEGQEREGGHLDGDRLESRGSAGNV